MPTASSLAWKTLSEKSRLPWYCSRLKERALYSWLIVVDIRQVIDRCSNIWASTAGRWLWLLRGIRLTAWLQNSKKRAERSERLMYEQSQRDYLRLVICIIVCLSWAGLIITVITPLPTKPSATKMPENRSWRTRQLLTCRCASAWCCCAWCKIHEGVSWC